jgi:hypothetical protein
MPISQTSAPAEQETWCNGSVGRSSTSYARWYLEAGSDDAVATGYDPLMSDEPALARTTAASVQQCIAFGERAGQQVRRMGAGFGYEGEHPALTGSRCASVNGFSWHTNIHMAQAVE